MKELIPYYIIRSYVSFIILTILFLWCDITDFGHDSQAGLAVGIAFWVILIIIAPLNTVIIFLLYRLKLNCQVLTKYKFTIAEIIVYILCLYACEHLLPFENTFGFILPYLIIIPSFALYGLIKRKLWH
jgi:hypothetical protein